MKKTLVNLFPTYILRFFKQIYLSVRGYYFKGNTYKCPVCNKEFRKMLPGGFDLEVIKQKEIIGSGLRNNNICPYCQSTDRDRLVFLYLSQKTQIFNQAVKILHISPEPALYNAIKKHDNILYVTGTKYAEGIYYHKEIDLVDLLDLPYYDGEFDMVICNHVLEHIIDDTKAISEIYRVTTYGGLAILQVPVSEQLEVTYEDESIIDEKSREKHFGQFDHVRIYGKDYRSRLENSGFKVEMYHPSVKPERDSELNRFALNKDEKLFVAHKN